MTKTTLGMMHGVLAVAMLGLVGCAAPEETVGTSEAQFQQGSSVILIRSVTPSGHCATAWQAPSNAYYEEARYGIRSAGDRALYSCYVNGHTMASTDPGCEGQRHAGLLGYVSATTGVPLYRCRVGGDHFITTAADCEGQAMDGLLGFVEYQAPGQGGWLESGSGSGDGTGGGGGSGDGEGGGVGAGGSL
jgi:hypothetical protein